MIDLTRTDPAGVHQALGDPGLSWHKDGAPAIDAPPDSDRDPLPEARWPADSARRGVCGSVSPRVLRLADASYRMYYTQMLPRAGFAAGANDYENTPSRILSAVSADGQSWRPEPGVRLSAAQGGAGEFRVVSSEVVPVLDGSDRLRMYYECCPGTQSVQNSIRSAVSTDGGLEWTPDSGVRLQAAGSGQRARITWLRESCFLPTAGCESMSPSAASFIVSALSVAGGLTFVMEPGPRMPGVPSGFAPDFVQLPDGSYRIYFVEQASHTLAGFGGAQHVATATSIDGLSWRRAHGAVIAPGGTWDAAKCSEMCVVPLADDPAPSPQFRMLCEACDGTTPDARGVWRIASATADPSAT